MATFKVNVSKDLLKRIEAEAEAREVEGEPGEFLAFLVEYALNRIDVLAKHAAKVRAVKEAKDAGKKIPKGIEFRRYVPAFTDKALDAEGTDREIAVWAHKAPVKAPAPKVERKPAPKADKVEANERRIKEIEAKLAKPAPAARPPVVRKAGPSTPAKRPGIATASRALDFEIPVC